MKKPLLTLTILLIGFSISSNSFCQTEQGALDATEAYFTAKMCDDYETLLNLTLPDLIEQAGGRESMRATLSKIHNNQRSKGIILQDYKIKQEIKQAKTKLETHVLIPIVTVSKVPGGTVTSESHLIAVGLEGNSKWHIVETSSLNEYNIHKVIANWDNTIVLPYKKAPVFKEDK
ncbi:hypothetical protein [Belliella aquatica]|uniref:DUF3828 domain-containing protein n=1 Tax=Belliella aquatica TaxID=1323734 RepID=A0ABQ1M3C6_9BACT|nr:hypothetical protein [Belliella aquatica]MCH7404933.1 hypothetical protein [Belliella aquatica]GGC33013.1 hypothetical protein GCM10010993_09850 [Belliella aquatica]